MSDLTETSLLAAAQDMRKSGPLTNRTMGYWRSPIFPFAGMDINIVDAQKQQRTERDVIGPWVRPRCPNRGGRKGTRRQWKRNMLIRFEHATSRG